MKTCNGETTTGATHGEDGKGGAGLWGPGLAGAGMGFGNKGRMTNWGLYECGAAWCRGGRGAIKGLLPNKK